MSVRILDVSLVATIIMALLAACAGATEPTPAEVDLEGTRWVLEALNGTPPIPGSEITLEFQDGNAAGSAGCNSYGGSYTAEGGQLSIPEIVRTEMACLEPEGIMEQEDAYLNALQNAASYQVVDDRLQIMNATGEAVLTFRMAG